MISPPSSATATPMSECCEAQDAVVRPHRIGGGNALQRRRPGLDDEVVERELERRLAIFGLGRGGIGLLAHGDQPADSMSAVR